ncbi:MAG: hypothetical protein MR739_04190 [Spirochaetia bacterium]|nr:hypothetical protein [Spirochaetia bacterium]
MPETDVLLFAKNKGFTSVQKLGFFNSYLVFRPLLDSDKKRIGFPQYILIKDEEINLKIDLNLDITKFFKS